MSSIVASISFNKLIIIFGLVIVFRDVSFSESNTSNKELNYYS